jgi:hypothetical protein
MSALLGRRHNMCALIHVSKSFVVEPRNGVLPLPASRILQIVAFVSSRPPRRGAGDASRQVEIDAAADAVRRERDGATRWNRVLRRRLYVRNGQDLGDLEAMARFPPFQA